MRLTAGKLRGTATRSHARPQRGVAGPPRRRAVGARYAQDPPPGGALPATNPLEQLRSTKDPRERARLLQALDARWGEHQASYVPSAAERLIASELGVWPNTVMLFALQTPRLQDFDADREVRPAVRSLKAALAESGQDAYFVITKRPDLLGHPVELQRWMDYLGAAGVGQRDVMAFLLAAPAELYTGGTLHQANQVVAWLRSVGIKADFLWNRIICPCPALLLRDPAADLQPLASYLLSLGVSPTQLQQLACLRPELLAASIEGRLRPFVAYLASIGCSAAQAGEVLVAAPHAALRDDPAGFFAPRLAALEAAGVGRDRVSKMLSRGGHTGFLTAAGAPGEALACLASLGYTPAQVVSLVTECPAILAEKPLELERKVAFLSETLVMDREAALSCPAFLAASLMQVIGPRHAFAEARQREGAVRATDGGWDLAALATGEDVDYVEMLGGSVNEYEGFRVSFEQEYTSKMSADAALEFQQELKRLGIWEGA